MRPCCMVCGAMIVVQSFIANNGLEGKARAYGSYQEVRGAPALCLGKVVESKLAVHLAANIE